MIFDFRFCGDDIRGSSLESMPLAPTWKPSAWAVLKSKGNRTVTMEQLLNKGFGKLGEYFKYSM